MFDIELKGTNKEFEDWAKNINFLTKRMSATLYLKSWKNDEFSVVLYSKYYIDEEQVFRDSIHEITEATLEIILLEILPFSFKIFKTIPNISHILTELSLYDGKEPIIISQSKKIFRKIEFFLKKLGYAYKIVKIKKG
jgi:hypothetical protein